MLHTGRRGGALGPAQTSGSFALSGGGGGANNRAGNGEEEFVVLTANKQDLEDPTRAARAAKAAQGEHETSALVVGLPPLPRARVGYLAQVDTGGANEVLMQQG